MNINPKDSKFTIDVDLVEVNNSIRISITGYKILFKLMSKSILIYIYIYVKARNEKARKKKVYKKSQHFTARNIDITSSPESLSHEY
jgi:hypothetical protein